MTDTCRLFHKRQKSLAVVKGAYWCFEMVPGKMHPWLLESLRKEYNSLLIFLVGGICFMLT